MKKRNYYLALLTLTSVVLFSGCGKENTKLLSSNSNHSNYTPQTSLPTSTTIASENAPKVTLSDLTIWAGEEVDYMSAIESVENIDLNKSMISINSSNVDRFTPGSYTVYYTFDYMGQTAKNFIVVNVLENPTTEVETTSNDTSNIISSQENESKNNTNSNTQPSNSESDNNTTSSNQIYNNESNSNTKSTNESDLNNQTSNNESDNNIEIPDFYETGSAYYDENAIIPDAIFTLSTGETVTIKNTPSRYIVETFTSDSYSSENGENFRHSELKILLNTGEIQTIETVVTRVNETKTTE